MKYKTKLTEHQSSALSRPFVAGAFTTFIVGVIKAGKDNIFPSHHPPICDKKRHFVVVSRSVLNSFHPSCLFLLKLSWYLIDLRRRGGAKIFSYGVGWKFYLSCRNSPFLHNLSFALCIVSRLTWHIFGRILSQDWTQDGLFQIFIDDFMTFTLKKVLKKIKILQSRQYATLTDDISTEVSWGTRGLYFWLESLQSRKAKIFSKTDKCICSTFTFFFFALSFLKGDCFLAVILSLAIFCHLPFASSSSSSSSSSLLCLLHFSSTDPPCANVNREIEGLLKTFSKGFMSWPLLVDRSNQTGAWFNKIKKTNGKWVY